MVFPPGAYICFGDAMKRILPLLVLCLLLTGCVALPVTAPAEPMYLALTFDDGPSPQYTPRLLDGLKQRGVHATFFLIGQQVQDYPELVQRIRAEGHQIGNHTYDHAPLDRLSCGEAMADLSRCDGVLQELAGEGTYWVRPPYGFITEEELAAWSTPMLYWSVDTCDWECRDVQKVFAAICQARDGDVILLHDCYGTSVEAALQAIDCLSEQGVEFVTVEELFALRGQTAEAGHLYRRPEGEKWAKEGPRSNASGTFFQAIDLTDRRRPCSSAPASG